MTPLNLYCAMVTGRSANAKAEECTTPRIGSRNIKIKIGGGGLPRNQK